MIKKPQWLPPEIDEIRRTAEQIFELELAKKIRQISNAITKAALEKKIFESEANLHGELLYGLKTPHHSTIYEHLLHLMFFESQMPNKKLKLLDLCCGNGEFTFIARKRGHHCVATENSFNISDDNMNFSSLIDKMDCISTRRFLTRKILEVESIDLMINWDKPLPLSISQFDVVYINQSTIHFPGSVTPDYWKNHQWSVFLENLLTLLRPNGMVFITLADPSYLSLSNYLLQFFFEYSEIFPTNFKYSWWPLLIVHKNQTDTVKNLGSFSDDLESRYFLDFGRSNIQTIKSRL